MYQLDLFETTETEVETKLTSRQWAIYRLIRENSLINGRKTTQKEIVDTVGMGLVWNDDPKCHDHCSALWNEIKDINLSCEIEKLIISKDFEYWLGNEEETMAYIDKLWKDLSPRLSRYWKYLNKAKMNGYGKLLSNQLKPIDEDSKARAFVESFNDRGIDNDIGNGVKEYEAFDKVKEWLER